MKVKHVCVRRDNHVYIFVPNYGTGGTYIIAL